MPVEEVYEWALFVHVLSAIGLFAAITIEHSGGARIRRATTVAQLRDWVGYVRTVELAFPVVTLGLIVTGVWMALDQFSMEVGWVAVSFALVIVLAIAGPTVQGRKLKALHAELDGQPDGPLTAEQRAAASSPVVWVSIFAMSGAAVGIVANMTMKPQLLGALLWPLLLGVLAGVGGVMAARPKD